MKPDAGMLFFDGAYYVRQREERFFVCDQEGVEKDSGLEHIGDDYATLEEACRMVKFWASGGYWSDRPDR